MSSRVGRAPCAAKSTRRCFLSRRGVCFALLAVVVAACDCAGDTGVVEIRIAAASSLRELMEDSRSAFVRRFPDVAIRFSFDASSALARQIEASDAFDVFLSADADTVERVRARLEAESITPFLGNELVMVASEHADAGLTEPTRLVAAAGKIALAGEAVPAGKYARAMLARMGLLDALAPRIVSGDNVRSTLALVESGAADFGFVYATDAAIAKKAKPVWKAPAEFDPGVTYVAAVVAGAREPARDYVRWLLESEFQAVAVARGFKASRLVEK